MLYGLTHACEAILFCNCMQLLTLGSQQVLDAADELNAPALKRAKSNSVGVGKVMFPVCLSVGAPLEILAVLV